MESLTIRPRPGQPSHLPPEWVPSLPPQVQLPSLPLAVQAAGLPQQVPDLPALDLPVRAHAPDLPPPLAPDLPALDLPVPVRALTLPLLLLLFVALGAPARVAHALPAAPGVLSGDLQAARARVAGALPAARAGAPVAASPAAAPAAAPRGAGSAAVPVFTSGSLRIPDVTLLDQDGRPVRFWSDLVRGKVTAVSFVFTSCTSICLPIGANFARLRSLLAGRSGAAVQLISISIDPEQDTPARMKAWAAKFGAGPGWTQLTGPAQDVERLLRALQAYTPDFRNHSSLILVGNAATGTWQRISGLAPAAQIAAQLAALAAPAAPPVHAGTPAPRPASPAP